MKKKVFILSLGVILLIGCSTKNASQRVDEETTSDIVKTKKMGAELMDEGPILIKDISGTLKQSIIKQ